MTSMSESKHTDGGPAFPRTGEGFGNPRYDAPGMSLRDWFAGQALAGICAHHDTWGKPSAYEIACEAYDLADAMLAERAKAEG